MSSESNTEFKLRICHLADLHLGYRRYHRVNEHGVNQRENDVNVAFREAVDRLIALKPDLVLIAGDVFHTVRPSNSVLAYCFRQIKKLADRNPAPIVIVGGNHESPKRSDTGSPLSILSEIDRVYVSDSKREDFIFPDLSTRVCCLPHAALDQLDNRILRADDRYRFNILLSHLQLSDDWVTDFGGIGVPIDKLAPHEWDYIALGHVHTYQEVSLNTAYSGSIERTSNNIWAEASQAKGFLEVDLISGIKTFHALTGLREVVDIPELDVADLDPAEIDDLIEEYFEAIPGGIDGKIVRIRLQNIPRETYRLLDHNRLKKWRQRALNIQIEIISSQRRELVT
ncbi:MAG: exonuclease SbcCD subunit D, partial [Bdellovibrionales bacterium]|nr:exonuclease SbcCD subunit D [Bdellovibrionales bacterium]